MKILELLKKAKKLYLENKGKCGMCWAIKVIANEDKSRVEQSDKGHIPYYDIVKQIPEFNPEFLDVPIRLMWKKYPISVGLDFWWVVEDVTSRIEAFDKLIKLYEESDKEFVW